MAAGWRYRQLLGLLFSATSIRSCNAAVYTRGAVLDVGHHEAGLSIGKRTTGEVQCNNCTELPAVPQDVDPLEVASSASIDAEHFYIVSNLMSKEAMAIYIERLIDELGGYVDSKEQRLNINGMAPFYMRAASLQRYNQLVTELRSKTWALSPSGQMRAYVHKVAAKQCNNTKAPPMTQAMEVPLDEIGYECLAVLSSEEAMSRFITRVIYAYGGSVGADDVAKIEGMSRWFSGENGVQSFDSLLEELRHKEWGLCSEDCDPEKSNPVKNTKRALAPVAQGEPIDNAVSSLPCTVMDPARIETDSKVLCMGAGPVGPVMRWWESSSNSVERTSQMLVAWRRAFPNGAVFYDDGSSSCVMREAESAVDAATNTPKRLFTLVSASGPPHCNSSRTDSMDAVEPSIFVSPTTGTSRYWAAAWPERGTCTHAHRCPIVIMLHGAAEHGGPDKGPESFQNLANLALFRYAFQPGACSALASVIIFPQLLRQERWEWSGLSIYSEFVLPLLQYVVDTNPLKLDMERVALVGYSEGAVGAVHGALRHPNVFSYVMPVALTWGEWWEFPWLNKQLLAGIPEKPDEDQFRLKAIIMTMPELQSAKFYGSSSRTLSAMLNLFTKYGLAEKVGIHARWYAGLDHITILDAVFGRWTSSFNMLWRGEWE